MEMIILLFFMAGAAFTAGPFVVRHAKRKKYHIERLAEVTERQTFEYIDDSPGIKHGYQLVYRYMEDGRETHKKGRPIQHTGGPEAGAAVTLYFDDNGNMWEGENRFDTAITVVIGFAFLAGSIAAVVIWILLWKGMM